MKKTVIATVILVIALCSVFGHDAEILTPKDEFGDPMPNKTYLDISLLLSKRGTVEHTYTGLYLHIINEKSNGAWKVSLTYNCKELDFGKIEFLNEKDEVWLSLSGPNLSVSKGQILKDKLFAGELIKIRVVISSGFYGVKIEPNTNYRDRLDTTLTEYFN